jgi:uncharacterized protein YutE (UPF0331/DUF86 family)
LFLLICFPLPAPCFTLHSSLFTLHPSPFTPPCSLLHPINDIILCPVDISEECLKKAKRDIPDTYRDTILTCHEFLGEIVLKVAPLVRHRNETIHQYPKVNWQNIVTVKNRIPSLKEFVETARAVLTESPN